MVAAHDMMAAMRANGESLTRPGEGADEPARIIRVRPRTKAERGQRISHIDGWMEAAFHGLTHASETGEPFALVSCFVNGKPAAAIVLAHTDHRGTQVMPLFVAVDPSMSFASHPEDASPEEEEPP